MCRDFYAFVLCGGSGLRFSRSVASSGALDKLKHSAVSKGVCSFFGGIENVPKQYFKLGGREMFLVSIEKFAKFMPLRNVVLVLSSDTSSPVFEWVLKILSRRFGEDSGIKVCLGGERRQDSTIKAFECLAQTGVGFADKYVMIHDGARPLISKDKIGESIKVLAGGGLEGVICATPVTETIKQVCLSDGQLEVEGTVPRQCIYRAQTPQSFKLDTICSLHVKYRTIEATDDCLLLEQEGIPVKIVDSGNDNIKITTFEDYLTARTLMEFAGDGGSGDAGLGNSGLGMVA